MTNEKVAKSRPFFRCEKCHYECNKKNDYNKHLLTTKHQILTNPNEKVAKVSKAFVCSCGKSYKHTSSLCSHKKKCNVEENGIKMMNHDLNYNSILLKVIQQNQELHKTMMKQTHELQQTMQKTMQDMIPNIGNNNNNKTNNINLQFFLNEQCKDAVNIMDFINSLKMNLTDFEHTGKMGFVEGTSKIMIDGLRGMEIHKRPVHCSDIQNEILYVKDNNTWKQDNDNKDTMKRAIDELNKSNIKQLPILISDNPDKANDEDYMKIVSNIMTMTNEETDKSEIIKNVSKEVAL